MVTVQFVSAWGAYEARAIAELSESQAAPLVATGVAVPVDVAPPLAVKPAPIVEAPEPRPAKPARKRGAA